MRVAAHVPTPAHAACQNHSRCAWKICTIAHSIQQAFESGSRAATGFQGSVAWQKSQQAGQQEALVGAR